MLRMIDKEYIRKTYFLKGWSIHELSRQFTIRILIQYNKRWSLLLNFFHELHRKLFKKGNL